MSGNGGSTPGTLGAVVVGTGFGCYTHVRALRHAGFDVRGVVGRDRQRTKERARLFGVPRSFGSLTEALADCDPDAVTVATPPHAHAEPTLEAVAAGRHVLCEKPLARNAGEARSLLEAAEEAGVVHLLGTEFRYDAGQALLARAVQEGMVGTPRLAAWLMHVPVLVDPEAELPDWWADRDQGGGWLAAHGSQLIDQIRVTLGDFDGVSGSTLRVVDRPMSADDGFVVHFRLHNGCVGTLQSTAGDRGVLVETRVTGSAGTAWIDGVGSTVKVADADGVRTLPVPGDLQPVPAPPLPPGAVTNTYERMTTFGVEYGPYTRLAAAFRDRILARAAGRADPDRPGGPTPATFADGVAQMATLDAIRRSTLGGGRWEPVTMPDAAST